MQQTVPAALGGFRGLRGELLIALKKAPHPLTARELAEGFGVTPNALRRHLRALEDEGLVRYSREVRGVGAPVFAYGLTAGGEALFPQAYAPVLAAVLAAVREQAGPEGVVALLARQWDGLIAGAQARLAELPLGERAQLVAELRTSQGYMAEAATDGDGATVIREHHCAIRDVAEQFPEICAAEQQLLERLLGARVERRGHILGGCAACEYVVRETAPAAAPACCDAHEAVPCAGCEGQLPPLGAHPSAGNAAERTRPSV
jgi:DeoR family suf operon transcriptional repressor